MSTDRPHLRVVKATGEPVKRAVAFTDDGVRYVLRHTPCRGCERPTLRGDDITHYDDSWWHLDCARGHLARRPVSQAWFALAEQVVKRPSAFKPREVKVITQALLDIARPGFQIEGTSA